MEWFTEHQWQSWLGLALTLGVAELFSLDLILVMLAVGAVSGALTALVTDQAAIQIAVALVVSVSMMLLVRPIAKRRLDSGPDLVLGHAKLLGHTGVVTTALSGVAPGQVRVDGEIWTALPYDETLTFAVGDPIEVLDIRGATAYVHPVARLQS